MSSRHKAFWFAHIYHLLEEKQGTERPPGYFLPSGTHSRLGQLSIDYHLPHHSAGPIRGFLFFQAVDPDTGPWGKVQYSIYGTGSDL